MKEIAPEFEPLFEKKTDLIDYEELTYKKSQYTLEEIKQRLLAANNEIIKFQFNVKSKAKANVPKVQEKLHSYSYDTYQLFALKNLTVSQRKIQYSKNNEQLWITHLIEPGFGVTEISPRIITSNLNGPIIRRNIILPAMPNFNLSKYFTAYSFGRGLPLETKDILSVEECIEHPELLKIQLKPWSRNLVESNESLASSTMPKDSDEVWINQTKGFTYQRLFQTFKTVKSDGITKTKTIDHKEVRLSDFRQVDGAWIPYRYQQLDRNGEIETDYCITDVIRLNDPAAMIQKLRDLRKPQPGDSYQQPSVFFRSEAPVPSQN
ncbi:hypothetical protein K8I31_20045 [bacterium]|nr:hypothetical protein [bacterium]